VAGVVPFGVALAAGLADEDGVRPNSARKMRASALPGLPSESDCAVERPVWPPGASAAALLLPVLPAAPAAPPPP
jgi:hypothetical protein